MPTLITRTKKTNNAYIKILAKGFLPNQCNLCTEVKILKEFKHWKIINNKFPWDRIATINHMIMPKRHVTYEKLNSTEKKEFEIIKNKYIEQKYELLAEATDRKKSIPGHLHIHLLILKK